MKSNNHCENWECYRCGREYEEDFIPGGWLGNYYPLCDSCADSVLYSDETSLFFKAMTFHYSIGEFHQS